MTLQEFTAKVNALAGKLGEHIKQLRSWVGNLSSLNTSNKTSIVEAINEVKAQADATQSAQGNYIHISKKGQANGVAELDSDGKVPAQQLPSFVDDVLEGKYISATVFKNPQNQNYTPESGKIYMDVTDTNNKGSYRWTGSQYSKVESGGLVLGTTSSTAFRGDYGLVAYQHTSATNNPHNVTKARVGLGNVPNHAYATTSVANAGTSVSGFMNPKLTKDAVDSWVGDADPHQTYINALN